MMHGVKPTNSSVRVSRSALERKGIPLRDVRTYEVTARGVHPKLREGDILLVDSGSTSPREGSYYLWRNHEGNARVYKYPVWCRGGRCFGQVFEFRQNLEYRPIIKEGDEV